MGAAGPGKTVSSDANHRRVLLTPRLRIEPFAAHHLTERYVSWLNNPTVVRYSDQRFYHHTLQSCAAYAKSFENTPHFFWAILATTPDLGHIGNMTAYVDQHHSVADLGILIGETSLWGKGYGTEAWMAVCDSLLNTQGLRKITAGTIAPNKPMLGVMRRSGMVPDGRRRHQNLWEGQEVDVLFAALFSISFLLSVSPSPDWLT